MVLKRALNCTFGASGCQNGPILLYLPYGTEQVSNMREDIQGLCGPIETLAPDAP